MIFLALAVSLAWLSFASEGHAADIVTLDGRTYKSAHIQRADLDGLVIDYVPTGGGMGTARIPYSNLPDEIRQQYSVNIAAAAAADASAAEALARNRQLANEGNRDAQAWLGWWYDNFPGTTRDLPAAVKWYTRAANQGHATAQLWLATHYSWGRGVPQDYIEAYRWADLAAAQTSAATWTRDDIAKKLSPAALSQARALAVAFKAVSERSPGRAGNQQPKSDTAKSGTGFFVSEDGYLVTCAHVVNDASVFFIETESNRIPARLIGKDKKLDIALLKTTGTFQTLPLVADNDVSLGKSVFTLGFPDPPIQGVTPKLTSGEISSLAGIRDNPNYFQISVPVQPGNSGGALVDERGNVVGVIVSRLDEMRVYEATGSLPQNVNYAIKGGLVYDFLIKVPELSGKLKAPHAAADRDAATSAAERATVMVIAE